MSAPSDKPERPLAERASQQSGSDMGGMRATADRGIADATQRSMEHADGSAIGRASTGDAGGGARDPRLDLGGTNEPGAADTPLSHADRPPSDDRATPRTKPRQADMPGTTGSSRASDDEEDDEWRHEPVAPIDEKNPLESLGRAVADTLTSGEESEAETPKR